MTGSLKPRLVVLQGGRTIAAREITPGEEWRLGRHADSALPLEERSISRVHARVFCDATGVHLEEMGTPNGTFVDGQQVDGAVRLRDGNLVRLGQSTNPDPVLILFEDPGTRLLEAMAVPSPRAPAPPVEVEATIVQPAAVRTLRTERPPAPAQDAVAAPVKESRATVREPAPREGDDPGPPGRGARKGFSLGAKAIAASVAALAVLVWLVFAVRLTQRPWQSVRVEPLKVKAGGRVSLRGSEIEPSDTLKVIVDEAEAAIEGMAPGQVVFVVPRIAKDEAGVHTVPLKVERQGIVLLRQTLQYETVPEIEGLLPAEAAVGSVVTLRGTGLVADAAQVKVQVARRPATVVSASGSAIQFRVPVVTRSVPLEAAVDVVLGDWQGPALSLKVRPRDAPCFDLTFSARSVAARVWEVRHPLGPVLFVEATPPTPTVPVPPEVQQAVDVLGRAFAEAKADPTIRFDVRNVARVATVTVAGLGPAPAEVARFTPPLAAYVRERAPEVRRPELFPYWGTVVLNELLNVFAKRQTPPPIVGRDPLRESLKRLVELNVETGGQGCPTAEEMETLSPAEREIFDTASLRLPSRFGEVGGTWLGQLDNAFTDEANELVLEMRLELKQAGTTLSGRMHVYEARVGGIRWSPPPVEGLEGSIRLGAETRVELKVPPQPPYFINRLNAVINDLALEGTFITDKKKQGRFVLAFQAGE